MSKSIEITCPSCHGLLRLVEVPKKDTGECPTCAATIDLKKCLPDYVQNNLKTDGLFDDLPTRIESPPTPLSTISSFEKTEQEIKDSLERSAEVNKSNEQNVEKLISSSVDNASVSPSPSVDFNSEKHEINEASVPQSVNEEHQQNNFSKKLQDMEDQLKSLINKSSSPTGFSSNSSDGVNFSSADEIADRDVPQLEEKLVAKNSQLADKLETLDAVYQQLRAEHANLTKRFRTLEEERGQSLLSHSAAGAALSLKSGEVEKVVSYEKEKNKILKQKWQESLLQLKKTEEKMKFLATQLLQKDGLLKDRENYVSNARLQAESHLAEIEKQGERIRQEAETRKAFEKKILELTQEVEILKGEVATNEQARAHLEALLKSRDEEVAQYKQSFLNTQNKIDIITQEIVGREQTLASQLTEIEKSRSELEEDAKNLELEKSNLKKLVTELNQRLADVRESEEKVARELKDQEVYKNAFANERAELDQLRSDILRQKEEIESSNIQLLEKNNKLTEIQNLLLTEKQAFEVDRISFEATMKAKDSKALELVNTENKLTEQKVKLNQAEKLLKDKELQLNELEGQLNKKENDISKVYEEISLKKDDLSKQEEEIQAASLRLKQEEENYGKNLSLFNQDKNSISAEQEKLEAVRQRIKEDFVNLEKQKKEFEEYRKGIGNFITEQKAVVPVKSDTTSTVAQVAQSLTSAADVIKPSSTPAPSSPDKDEATFEEAAIQKKAPNKRFTPAPATVEKKRPQYRRFDEAQATKEDAVLGKSAEPSPAPEKVVVDSTPTAPPVEPQSKIPAKGDRKPLPMKSVTEEAPKKDVLTAAEGKALSEFAPDKKDQANKPRNTKKAKNKVFWSAGLILIPLTLCLGAVAYILTNDGQGFKASLPPIESKKESVVKNETPTQITEPLDMDDNHLLSEMEKFKEKNIGEGFSLDLDKSKELNESLMNNEIALPEDAVAVVEEKIAEVSNYDSTEITDGILSGIMDENELKAVTPVSDSVFNELVPPSSDKTLITEVDAPNVVKVKPMRNPLFDPQDVNRSDHIGMLPPEFLD